MTQDQKLYRMDNIVLGTDNLKWAKILGWKHVNQQTNNTGCSYKELPNSMNDRDEWKEEICHEQPSTLNIMILKILSKVYQSLYKDKQL